MAVTSVDVPDESDNPPVSSRPTTRSSLRSDLFAISHPSNTADIFNLLHNCNLPPGVTIGARMPAEDAAPRLSEPAVLPNATLTPRKRARPWSSTSNVKKPARSKPASPSVPTPDQQENTTPPAEPDPNRFTPKQIIVGTYYADPTSYVTASDEGLVISLQTDKTGSKSICLPYQSFADYIISKSPQLPAMILRGDHNFGDKVRKAIPCLKSSDSTLMSSRVFDPRSSDHAHWYIILEMDSAVSLINLMHQVTQATLTLSELPGGCEQLQVARTISLEEAKKKITATKTITLKWNHLQLGSWKSKPCRDQTILISGNRIRFKANKDGQSTDVILTINFPEVISLLMCIEKGCPVMFIRASEGFGWTARDRLGIPSTFQQGKDYYNSDNPETRFKYITFKLEPENLTESTWAQLRDFCEARLSSLQLLDTREAQEMVHNLLYRPIKCDSVRVGANEIDELRAVTIYSDSLYICGCMLDSVVTMHLCLGDITDISFCSNEKLPVIFIKTSTTIRDTLKVNMASRSSDVYFDPSSHDVRTQYIVFELAKGTSKVVLLQIFTTLQNILAVYARRPSGSKDRKSTVMKEVSVKKSKDLLRAIKEPLKATDCSCGKKVDWERKKEVKQYVQSMVQKHGCDALEKMANRVVDLEKKILCSVCLDKDCQVVFSCGHMICESCDLNLKKCHICRLKILRRVKIFI
ncbi:uncharacterized protein [Watersipora subatra]|uniref:uncharacterized protein n=1 Tax=Watersipora subatra TaxID=2589382 RepID=UPI00355C9C15